MNITKVLSIVVALAIFLVSASIIVNFIPWYMQENPMIVETNNRAFKPGEIQHISFTRRALIGFQGRVTRELVRVNETTGVLEEIWKSSIFTSIGAGKKDITLTYRIPTLAQYPEMKGNTYRWQGSMTYRPFGMPEKTFFFETEEFKIDVSKEGE